MRRFQGRFALIPASSFVLVLAACQAPTPKAVENAAVSSVDAISVVGGYLAAWNAHNAEKAASYMTDDVVYYDVSVGTAQVSRDSAQKNVIQAFLTAVPDCQWVRDTTPPIIGADGVAFQWTFSGTHTGPFADGTPATGKKFSFKGATLIRLRGDKIAFQSDYYDAYGFLKQLGLAK